MSLTKVSYSMIQGAEINVLDYGATGNGTTDDTAAIQAAINSLSASGGQVLFPAGTYKVTSTITLSSNIALVGNAKSVINLNVTEIGLSIPVSGTNITVSDLSFTGTCARVISSAPTGVCTNIKILNNTISGATLAGAGYTSGIFLLGASNCLVEGNILTGNGLGANNGFCADIAFYAPNSSSVGMRNKILNNTCKSTQVIFNFLAFNISNCLISGNFISGAKTSTTNNDGYGIVVYDTASYTLPYSLTNFNTISNNTVTGTQGTGIYVASCDNTTITGNTVSYVGAVQLDPTLPVGGIVLNGLFSSQNTITGNTISSSGKDGIVSSSNTTTTISGNTISASGQHGIHLRGLNQSISVVGNNISASTNRGIFDDLAAKTYITISGNSVYSSGSTGIEINGMTKSVISGNVSANNSLKGIVSNGNYNSITDNVLFDNTDGAFSGSLANGNMFRNNKFTNGASQGVATLVGGAVTVSTAEIKSTDIVLITRSAIGGTLGQLTVRGIVSGTSFLIDSSSGSETSSVYWQIVH